MTTHILDPDLVALYLKRAGMTAQQMADTLNVSRRTYFYLLKKGFSSVQAETLVNVLECELEDMEIV